MSAKELINYWASQRITPRITTDVAVFDASMDPMKIVFVAWLWSGNSQLAFRKLCAELERIANKAPPLLVIDADSEQFEQYAEHCESEVRHGNGLLLMFRNGLLEDSASGRHLESVSEKLRDFLHRCSRLPEA